MKIDRQTVSTGGTVTTIRQIVAAALRTAHATALFVYCLSYTATFLNFLPFGVVPFNVTVRLLPSAETTI